MKEEIYHNPDYVYHLESWEFEEFVAEVFENFGFRSVVTKRTHDGGRDIIATFEMGGVLYTTYFECKKYAKDRPVGVNIVWELYAVMERERANKGVIVTSYFTAGAIEEAAMFNGRIDLIDFRKLQNMMNRLY